MKKVLIISLFPYDETVGMAGTVLKHADAGDELNWLILTKPEESRWSEAELKVKYLEVENATRFYGFKTVRRLNFRSETLSEISKTELGDVIKGNLEIFRPNVVYIPFDGMVTGDYKAAFDCAVDMMKTFRSKIDRIYAYEIASPFSFESFSPNVYSDITEYMDKKQEVMNIYETEIQGYPLSRSFDSVKSLARVRGTSIQSEYAEAFMLIKEII